MDSARLAKYRKTFGRLFVVSAPILLLSVLWQGDGAVIVAFLVFAAFTISLVGWPILAVSIWLLKRRPKYLDSKRDWWLDLLRRWRRRLGYALLLSAAALVVLGYFVLFAARYGSAPMSGPVPTESAPPSNTLVFLVSLVSLLTSVVSLAGLSLTTIAAFRKERRDREHSDVDIEIKRLQAEKLRRELLDMSPKQDR